MFDVIPNPGLSGTTAYEGGPAVDVPLLGGAADECGAPSAAAAKKARPPPPSSRCGSLGGFGAAAEGEQKTSSGVPL